MVRVSGAAAGAALEALGGWRKPARQARLARISGADGRVIDDALTLFFAAPHSATGEDVAEFHVHGGGAVIAAVLGALGRQPGLRPAGPGEFTRRAFENGKFDLTQAEAVADLIDAETETQRRQAVRQLDGELGRLYAGWAERLGRLLAHAEAGLDFSDEDLPANLEADFGNQILALQREIADHLDDGERGERLRAGYYVAIIGAPNVGKSTLLNRLARRDAAIVAATGGTTRDVIEVHLDIGGFPVVVADTAGLGVASGAVEAEGVRRARARAGAADLTLAVFDAGTWPTEDVETAALVDERTIRVWNKLDLAPAAFAADGVLVSALNGVGLDRLEEALRDRVAAEAPAVAGAPLLTRQRHRQALESCAGTLERALEARAELRAEDLRLALRSLARITGRVDVEDLLDTIFADFCIGK